MAINDYVNLKTDGDNLKKDYGKDPWHLFPYDAARGIVKVLAFGAKKYSARGWEEGMDWSRVYGALQRHLVAWFNREGTDPDTGYSHLWHAGCCIMFLIAYEMRNVGNDDRPDTRKVAKDTFEKWVEKELGVETQIYNVNKLPDPTTKVYQDYVFWDEDGNVQYRNF